LAFVLGGVAGIMAAVLGGWFDQFTSRLVDVLMAIPALIFAMLLLTIGVNFVVDWFLHKTSGLKDEH